MEMVECEKCLLCRNELETISHLFYYCSETRNLWLHLEHKIYHKANFSVHFECEDVILEYVHVGV